MVPKSCASPECFRPLYARGMCYRHHKEWMVANPELVRKSCRSASPEDRFWAKVSKTSTCWEWTGSLGIYGHGAFQVNGKNIAAYRFSYELANGPIPDGLVIDHICHYPPCVNPQHLRAVTQKQNLENLRGAHVNSRSGFRGVWGTPSGKWRAEVKHHGVRINLGTFASIEEANAAAVAKRNELFTCNDSDRK